MELRNFIEAGEEKVGGRKPLALILEQAPNAITNAKANRQGLPNYACVKLAELLGVERIEVIAASELVTEKNPERREVWLPFVLAAEARQHAQAAQQSADQTANAETKTAPAREPSESLVVEFSLFPNQAP